MAVALGNRADLSQQTANFGPSRIDNWIWQSYLELGMGYAFSEAEFTVSDLWDPSDNLNGYLAYPATARMIKSAAFYRTVDGTAIQVKWKDIAYLRKYANDKVNAVGPPSIVAPFNDKLYIRPFCDAGNTYDAILDFWQKPQQLVGVDSVPPFPPYIAQGSADIGATQILVPDDWLEVVDMGAILRGHVSLLEREKAQELQSLLFGFTMPSTGKNVPGLIGVKWNRRQAQAPAMDYNIQPTQAKKSYTSVG